MSGFGCAGQCSAPNERQDFNKLHLRVGVQREHFLRINHPPVIDDNHIGPSTKRLLRPRDLVGYGTGDRRRRLQEFFRREIFTAEAHPLLRSILQDLLPHFVGNEILE
jgi:hypothetical protein